MKHFFALLLILAAKLVLAQNLSGCIIVFPYGAVASYPAVYPTPLGINVPTGQNADIVGKPAYSNTGGISVSHSCYRDPNPTSTRECAVRVANGASFIWYGGVMAQNYYQCPMDDGWVLTIVCGLLASIFIKKRYLLLEKKRTYS